MLTLLYASQDLSRTMNFHNLDDNSRCKTSNFQPGELKTSQGHYPPRQPSGSRSMSKVGTWFLMVHVTSLDRIWPKLNLPSGAYGEKCIFACFRGLLAIFLLERSILFFRQSVESNYKLFGHKKMGVTLQEMVI